MLTRLVGANVGRGQGDNDTLSIVDMRLQPPRTRSALPTSDSPQLFERRERSERREFCGATSDRAAQRSRRLRRPPRLSGRPGAVSRARVL